jgi:hypothetical protein
VAESGATKQGGKHTVEKISENSFRRLKYL